MTTSPVQYISQNSLSLEDRCSSASFSIDPTLIEIQSSSPSVISCVMDGPLAQAVGGHSDFNTANQLLSTRVLLSVALGSYLCVAPLGLRSCTAEGTSRAETIAAPDGCQIAVILVISQMLNQFEYEIVKGHQVGVCGAVAAGDAGVQNVQKHVDS